MAKGIHTIEARIISLLRHNKGTRMSSASMGRQLGVSKETIESGIGKIQINVLLPNEVIFKSGAKGHSKYELGTDKTLTCDVFDQTSKDVRSFARKGIKIVKEMKIAIKTRNRQDIARTNQEFRVLMRQMSSTASDVALLQLPLVNI